MFKTIFIISLAVVGAVEWLKNLLPAKAVENNTVMASISGAISAFIGVAYVAFGQKLGFSTVDPASWQNYVIYAVGTIGCVQVCYQTLLQTFKAIVSKLKSKATIEVDSDKIADEIVGEITKLGEKAVEGAVSKKSK